MHPSKLALACLLASSALSAHAGYTTVGYTGIVSTVHAATSGPEGPTDIQVGTPVTFAATFDMANAVNRSATFFNIDHLTGQPVSVPGLATISIADDPSASYTVTIGSHVFTSASDDLGGQDHGFGAGNFPFVVYNGSQLLGIDGEADVDGFTFSFDPLAYMLHYSRAVGNGYYDANGDYGYRVTTSLDEAINAAPAAAVPEPSSWALLLVGGAGLVWSRRRGGSVR